MYVIYEIVGRKVGCTKDLDYRMHLYGEMDGKRPTFVRIRERIPLEMGDQYAGDREWHWADELGYKRGNHYTVIMHAVRVRGKRSTEGRIDKLREAITERNHRRMETMTAEERSAIARTGGLVGGRRRAETTTPERRSEIGRMGAAAGAAKGNRRAVELKRTGAFKRGVCPHCGFENNALVLGRFHGDRCPVRKVRLIILNFLHSRSL